MKTQMRFQKILMIVTLIIGALGVVYALIFSSGVINQINQVADPDTVGSVEFSDQIQSVNNTLLALGVIFVVITVLPFVAGCHSRRNYYITNYIATGIVVVYEVIFAVMLVVLISQANTAYLGVDIEDAAYWYDSLGRADMFGEWQSGTPWTFGVGYGLMALALADAVVLILNLIWKTLLMKGEKALLARGFVKEVA